MPFPEMNWCSPRGNKPQKAMAAAINFLGYQILKLSRRDGVSKAVLLHGERLQFLGLG